jgi:hypothetical protein
VPFKCNLHRYEVDAFAPNQGSAPPPGAPVPRRETSTPEPPEDGRRGARAFGEAEFDELRRQRDVQRKAHEKEEEKRLAGEAKRWGGAR